jgi:hypothetical protein
MNSPFPCVGGIIAKFIVAVMNQSGGETSGLIRWLSLALYGWRVIQSGRVLLSRASPIEPADPRLQDGGPLGPWAMASQVLMDIWVRHAELGRAPRRSAASCVRMAFLRSAQRARQQRRSEPAPATSVFHPASDMSLRRGEPTRRASCGPRLQCSKRWPYAMTVVCNLGRIDDRIGCRVLLQS